MIRRAAPFAPWVHAFAVGLVAIATFYATGNEVVTAAVVVAAARLLGEALGRVRPRARHLLEPQAHLAQLHEAVDADIHRLVDVLAILKAELDLSIDTARRRLEAHYRQEERDGRHPNPRQ